MDIKVSGRKTTVTDALRAHVDEKIGEALKVFDIEPMTVDVVLRYEKNPSNPPVWVERNAVGRGQHWTPMAERIGMATVREHRPKPDMS